MTMGLEAIKVGTDQLTVIGIFHDDETAWLEAFPQSGGRIEAVQGDALSRR
jgi:hypothetical protein